MMCVCERAQKNNNKNENKTTTKNMFNKLQDPAARAPSQPIKVIHYNFSNGLTSTLQTLTHEAYMKNWKKKQKNKIISLRTRRRLCFQFRYIFLLCFVWRCHRHHSTNDWNISAHFSKAQHLTSSWHDRNHHHHRRCFWHLNQPALVSWTNQA